MAEINTLRKVARIEDQATGKVVERIRFRKLGGGKGFLELPPSIVNDRRAFERQLRDVGAALPHDRKATANLLEKLASAEPKASYVYAARCGWTNGRRAYVLPQQVIGSPAEPIVGINPALLIGDKSGSRVEAGTWRGWRREVAEPAGQSSLLMSTIAFALAGPFLSHLGRDSRTLCLCGPSRSGKTTATLVAASVIGVGRAAELPTWNLTDARLEQQLALFNDSIFPIDDLTTIGGRPRDAYQRIRDLAYRLHQGWGRGRHSSFSMANNTIREQWRAIGITSSEIAIRDLAEAAGCQRQPGECVRLIDVPILINGEDRLFDRANKIISRRGSAVMLRQIVDGVDQHHGSVFRRHVLNVIKAGSQLVKFSDNKIRRFCDHVKACRDGNLSHDVAETFGLAYAAGCFAIQHKLVLWRESDLLDALTIMYRGAREMLPDDRIVLRSGLDALRELLRDIRNSTGQAGHKRDFEKSRGVFRNRRSYRRYLVKGDAFNAAFATTREKALVTNWLLRKDRMTAAGPSKGKQRSRTRPKDQIIWPDGKRRRSVEILWPRRPKRQRAR